jgi:tetratricopeptide (TPR) repeat protein
MTTIRLTAALLLALPLGAVAQTPQQEPFQIPGLLIRDGGGGQRAWIVAATKAAIRYRETPVAVETVDVKISDYKSIFLYEPREYAAAMDLYQARKYEEAKAKFIEVKERYKPVYPLENSPAALAAFHEMECLRKLGDLDGLAAALQKFDKDPLTRESQLRQLELYVMWDAVRAKSWESLEKLARERAETRLPSDQRAQVAYCHGLALEGLRKPDEALAAYQMAMVADAGTSEDIARAAALRVLAILTQDAEVKKAIREWDAEKGGPGNAKLNQAVAVAGLYEMTLGVGSPLPAEYQELLKYRPKKEPEQAPAEEAAKPEAKPDAKAEPKPGAGKPDPKKTEKE